MNWNVQRPGERAYEGFSELVAITCEWAGLLIEWSKRRDGRLPFTLVWKRHRSVPLQPSRLERLVLYGLRRASRPLTSKSR